MTEGILSSMLAQGGSGPSARELLNAPQTAKSLWGELSTVTVVLGAALLVGLLLFLAVWWWKRAPESDSISVSGPHHAHRGKRRKRLRSHRPRNPTLAETGGLPPLRDEGPPPPPP
jgi:hypothetical protein